MGVEWESIFGGSVLGYDPGLALRLCLSNE